MATLNRHKSRIHIVTHSTRIDYTRPDVFFQRNTPLKNGTRAILQPQVALSKRAVLTTGTINQHPQSAINRYRLCGYRMRERRAAPALLSWARMIAHDLTITRATIRRALHVRAARRHEGARRGNTSTHTRTACDAPMTSRPPTGCHCNRNANEQRVTRIIRTDADGGSDHAPVPAMNRRRRRTDPRSGPRLASSAFE